MAFKAKVLPTTNDVMRFNCLYHFQYYDLFYNTNIF